MNMRTRLDELNRVLGLVARGGRGRVVESRRGSVWRNGKRLIEEAVNVVFNKGQWKQGRKVDPKDVFGDFLDLVASGGAPNDLERTAEKSFWYTFKNPHGRYDKIAEVLSDYVVEVGDYKYIEGGFLEHEDEILRAVENDCVRGDGSAISVFMGFDDGEKNDVLTWMEKNAGRDSKRAAANIFEAMLVAATEDATYHFFDYRDNEGIESVNAEESIVVSISENYDDFVDAFSNALRSRLVDYLDSGVMGGIGSDIDNSDFPFEDDIDAKETAMTATSDVFDDFDDYIPDGSSLSDIIDSAKRAANAVAQNIIDAFEHMIQAAYSRQVADAYGEVFADGIDDMVEAATESVPFESEMIDLFYQAEKSR